MGRDTAVPFTGINPVFPRVNHYTATKPVVEERISIPTSSITNTAGSFSYFEVGRQFDGGREWHIEYDRAAGTYTAANTVPFFEDWEIYARINYVQILYNNKVVWLKKGEQMLEDMLNGWYLTSIQGHHERAAFAQLQNGGLSILERQQRFVTAQTKLKAPLQVPWRHIHKSLIHLALPNKLRVEVYWNTDNQCVHQPLSTGTTVGAMTNLNLIIEAHHYLEEDRGKLYYDIYDGKMPYQIKTVDWEYEWRYGWIASVVGGNADASQNMIIRNLRNNSIGLSFKLQYQDHVDSAQTLDRQKPLPLRSVELDDQGRQVTVVFNTIGLSPTANSQSLMLNFENTKSFPNATPGSLLYFIKFCPPEYVIASEHNCFGSRNISKYSNPSVTIHYNSSINSVMPFPDFSAIQVPSGSVTLTKMYLTVTSYIHQLIFMGQSDFRRFLLV